MEKDRDLRYQHASEMRADLKRLKRDTASGKTATVDAVAPVARRKLRWLGPLAAVIAILAIAATFAWLRLPQTPPRVLSTTQLTKDGVPKYGVLTDGLGRKVDFKNSLIIMTSNISPDHSQLLVENMHGFEATEFWALPLPSGPPRRIAGVTGANGTWSPDGRQLVFAKGDIVYLARHGEAFDYH